MVTGVETAGFVLAAFPVVVEGLVIYINGIQKIKQLRRCHDVLELLKSRLSSQSAFFRQSIEKLFAIANVFDPEDIDKIFNDFDDSLWRDDERNKALKDFLGSSYQSYIQTITTLHQSITKLGKKLRIDPSLKEDTEVSLL